MLKAMQDTMLLGPAAAARRLGISVKALRVYEQQGLIRPRRTRLGWRAYATEDLERVSRALDFKAMGFGLAQIAVLLDAGGDAVAAALVAQEVQLRQRRVAIDESLEALREARRNLGGPTLKLAA
jgi:DNA-binding transcriptional MerR regulator